MPRKLNINVEYSRRITEATSKKTIALEEAEKEYRKRLDDAERKRKAALEEAENMFNIRIKKIDGWKAAEVKLEEEAEKARKERAGKPRASKFDREIEECKKRQKEQFQKSKEEADRRKEAKLPTVLEEKRADIFSAFTSLMDEEDKEEEEEEDMWDISGMTHDSAVSYIKSKIKQGEKPPSHLLEMVQGEKKEEKKEKKLSFANLPEKPAEPAKPASLPLLDFDNVKNGGNFLEKKEKNPPQSVPPPSRPKKPIRRVSLKEVAPGVCLYPTPQSDD